jgi:hypothetical protein
LECKHFYVKLARGQDTIEGQPLHIADLDDNENNIDLCIKEAGVPNAVRVDANIAIDPNDDLEMLTSHLLDKNQL